MSSFKGVIAGVLLILLGGYGITGGWATKAESAALSKDGVVVAGKILAAHPKKGIFHKRRGSCWFRVSYRSAGGRNFEEIFDVTTDFFSAHATGEQVTNDRVKVKYLPQDPDTAIIVGGTPDYRTSLYLSVGLTLVGLIFCLYHGFGGNRNPFAR